MGIVIRNHLMRKMRMDETDYKGYDRDRKLVKFAIMVMLQGLEEAGVLVRNKGVDELFPESVVDEILKVFEEEHEN